MILLSLKATAVNAFAHTQASLRIKPAGKTKEDNAHDTDILDFTGMGDEAFLLSNNSNNHFIMVRKGGIIMRLQIKNAPGKNSLDELKAFAEKASKQL